MTDTNDLIASNSYIESELTRRLKALEACTDTDFIVCIHPIMSPFDDLIRNEVEDIPEKKKSLFVVLETDGGSIETTERIADVMRHHYKDGEVSFIIPNYAMSAGTVLVMSGDRILMDYYSILGPIDPQIGSQSGGYVPALGYLEKYNQFIAKSQKGALSAAELAFLIEKFDPADLYRFEQAREHSVDLLQQWLVKHKFKNWSVTETRGLPVTDKMRRDRAKKVAGTLNDTKKWRSHGRGLSMEVIRRDLNIQIEDYGTDPNLAELASGLRLYYRLLKDYMQRRGRQIAIHTRAKLFPQ